MKASAFEFRLRFLLHCLVYVLGFAAPWNYVAHLDSRGPNAHTWGLLAAVISKAGITDIGTAFDALLIFAILFAIAGASLRTWGSAYLGVAIVKDGAMHTGAPSTGIVADGPFRHLRNPLYVGTMLHTLAVSLLMPPSGAIFAIVAVAIMQVRLILGEEAFLTAKLGPAYTAYCALVPRIVPSIRSRVPASGEPARWPQAFLGEIYVWGVAISFAALGWRYNASLLIRCVLVSLGVSLVARAFTPKPKPAAEVTA